MQTIPNVSSEEELLQLREEGKISEAQYHDLLAAMRKSVPSNRSTEAPREPEFRAFRKRVLIGGMIICWIGLPAGFILDLPLVWGLSIVGLVVAGIKMRLLNR